MAGLAGNTGGLFFVRAHKGFLENPSPWHWIGGWQMDLNNQLAHLKSAGSPSLRLEWQAALAAHPLFSLPGAGPVISAASAPAQLIALAEMARSEGPEDALAGLLEAVDASDAPIGDWLKSLLLLRDHLRQTHRRIGLSHALGYLDCCAATTATTNASLPETTADMLDRYGIEA